MEYNSTKEIFAEISNTWFMNEPLLFNIMCTHNFVQNKDLLKMFRTGKGVIEYNSDLMLQSRSLQEIIENLKIEMFRIILKHPYQRVPDNPKHSALGLASDITLNEYCHCSELTSAKYYDFPKMLSFEEYYQKLKLLCPDDEDLDLKDYSYLVSAQTAGLWTENEPMCELINAQIQQANNSNQWGSISDCFIEEILASCVIPMDYRRILSLFRMKILSHDRKLIRTKPNRRYGFDYMGSKYESKTNLAVAVDVSGSISSDDLKKFFSIINRFFSYGVNRIEVITFDTEIKQQFELKKAKRKIQISGRGGTDFQDVIDWYMDNTSYQALIIFTDGYAEIPYIKYNKNILWILNSKLNYERSKQWIKQRKGSMCTWIP